MADTKFKRNKPRHPNAGRKKGSPNKVSKNIKDNFEAVFIELGGIDGFYKWADKNAHTQGAFYQMYSKMLPSNIGISGGGDGKPIIIEIVPAKEWEKKNKKAD